MEIQLVDADGVVLETAGKHCAEDIEITPILGEKSVTPTTSQQTVEAEAGTMGLKQVIVGAIETETANLTPTKGAQTVYPSDGKTFSKVELAAIPDDYVIPSGTEQITANGVYDVSGKANANVNVEPNLEQKTVTVTTNGTTEVTPTTGKDGISKVTINTNVPTASAVEEVATAAAMNALLVEANVGKYYKFTGTTDSNYTNGDLYLVEGGAVSNHTLTIEDQYSYADKVTVNDNIITSPYTLQNGDVIKVPTLTQGITINGTSYSTRSENVLSISNEDITVTRTGAEKVFDPVPYITINYTA